MASALPFRRMQEHSRRGAGGVQGHAQGAVERLEARGWCSRSPDAGGWPSRTGAVRPGTADRRGAPRGGVPVAAEVAKVLGAPLDVLAVRKLGAPGNPELAVGAVAEDGTGVVDGDIARRTGMTRELFDRTLERESRELRRRTERYRAGRAAMDVRGRTVIVVDDGLATGLTDLAAVRALRAAGASRIVVAAPVGSRGAVARLFDQADDARAPHQVPGDLWGVGQWYRDFSPVEDARWSRS